MRLFNLTYTDTSKSTNACGYMSSQISLKDELSTVNIQCFGYKSCFMADFVIDTPSLNINPDNNILTNANVSRIYYKCWNGFSCQFASITIIGVNNFEFNCTNKDSCRDAQLTVTALETIPSGELTVNCDGDSACRDMTVNGITMNKLDINCLSGHQPCQNIQVTFYKSTTIMLFDKCVYKNVLNCFYMYRYTAHYFLLD